MRSRNIIGVAALASLVLAAPAGAATIREFEGTIKSVNSENRTFKIFDSEAGTKRVKVTSRTRFERIDGFGGLKVGMKNVETRVKRSDGRWVALDVEKSGGGGNHGGGRGGDDDS